MSIPLSIILFDRGANGVPTTSNPVNLAGRAESYEDTVSDRYGFETARVAWTPTWAEIEEWARYDHLMRPMVAYSPDARQIWRGVLAEIEISIGTKKIAFSLKDMANRLTVRFSEPGGAQGDSTTYSNAASQALFGRKDRVINASVALSVAASNQAQTILNAIAFPRSKQSSAAGTTHGNLQITLTFWGKYALLDWLLTSSTSTTSTASSTQIASLLASYAATNAFFSSSAASIAATGVSDTEYIEPDTTYREKIERLCARGNSAQQPLAWGFYDDDAFVVAARASANPSTITYYESEASGQIRDQWQNVVEPWDVRPNAMALVTDLIDAPTPGSIETPLRKYVARVTRSVRGEDVTVTLEPDDTESLEDLLTSPAGAGPAGTSERQAAFERKVTAPARSVFAGMDNATRYDRSQGVWKPAAGGTGKVNTGTLDVPSDGTLDLGGTKISNSGGNDVDVGTGDGIGGTGSSGVSTPSAGGTIGLIPQWTAAKQLGDSTLKKTGGGLLTFAASSPATLTIDSSIRLTGSGATSGQVLAFNGTAFAPTTLLPSDIGAIDGSGTAGRLAQFSDADTITAATLAKSGGGVLTLSAGSTAVLTIDSSIRLTGSGATSGQALVYNGTAFAPTTLAASDIGAGPDDATYIVKTANSGLSNEFALSTLSTGLLKVTTTTGALTTATASDLPNHASRHQNGGADELALDGGQITTGTVAAGRLGSGTSITTKFLRGDNSWQTINTGVGGSGTAGRVMQWASGGADAENSTLAKSGAGLLMLAASGAATLTVDSTIRFSGTGAASGKVLAYDGTAFSPTTLTASDVGAIDGSGTAGQVPYFSGSTSVTGESAFQWSSSFKTLSIAGTVAVTGSNAGIDMYDRSTGSSDLWSIYSQSNELRFWEDDNGDQYRMTTAAFYPTSAGTKNLGTASLYWNEVNYKLLTDRGCIGWYDEGVELRNGQIVSDIEALQAIKVHPYLRTPAGARRLDYATMPRHVFREAPIAKQHVYNDDGTVKYRAGEKMGEDGAETSALIGILIGSIKELAAENAAMRARLDSGGL